MGSNKSKQTKQPKPYPPPKPPKPVEVRPAPSPSPPPEPKPRRRHVHRRPQVLPRYPPRRDRLYNPQSVRPIELSWLQKNGKNDDYSRINYHYHNLHQPHNHGHYQHRHYHQHNLRDHEHDTPIPLVIKRWPISTDKFARLRFRLRPEFRSKSFIDEYVYQRTAAV